MNAYISRWGSVDLIYPTPLGKVLNRDNEVDEEFIKFRKESSSKLGRKEIHQGEIRFWGGIKLWEKE